MTKPEKTRKTEVLEQILPLVIEIMPGQAAEGLIDIYEPGSFEEEPLRKLCEKMLNERTWSIEEQQILEDINRQLDGGRLICRGRQIDGPALDHAAVEETESGEKYLYVPIRAIKPQEGGGHREESGMEPRERKGWNPDCPKCREELQRHIELWKAVFDEVDHGVAKGAPFEFHEYRCDHESGKKQ